MSFMGGSGPFDNNPLKDVFERAASAKKEEKGVAWEAKVIDGKYYIPLSQVAELLKLNGVLPKVRAGIERRVEMGPGK
jgi:hypothetical protein